MPADRLGAFETIMGGTPRIWIAGIIAYGVSQFLNVTIFSALRGKGEGRMIWLRAGIAAILSQIVDTLLFITISFYGEFPITDLLLGQMLAKVVLSIVLVPPLVSLAVALGRRLDCLNVPRAITAGLGPVRPCCNLAKLFLRSGRRRVFEFVQSGL